MPAPSILASNQPPRGSSPSAVGMRPNSGNGGALSNAG
jgi:hypothetical protein